MRYGAIELERANGADILRHFVPVARGSASPPSRSMFIHGIWVFPDPAQAVAAKRSRRVSSPALRKVCMMSKYSDDKIVLLSFSYLMSLLHSLGIQRVEVGRQAWAGPHESLFILACFDHVTLIMHALLFCNLLIANCSRGIGYDGVVALPPLSANWNGLSCESDAAISVFG
jgi:hypothetical protein